MSLVENTLIRRFIEDAGNTTQSLGVGRAVGMIYAYLYFSEPPRTLDDMKEALGISKGSASMSVRQLEQWGAVQRVWVKGDRKDYYTANDYFGSIIRNLLADIMGKRLESLSQSLAMAETELSRGDVSSDSRFKIKDPGSKIQDSGSSILHPVSCIQDPASSPDRQFLRNRVARLRDFQSKVDKTLNNPIVKMVLK